MRTRLHLLIAPHIYEPMSDIQNEILQMVGAVTAPGNWTFSDLRQMLPQESDLTTRGARWPFGGVPLSVLAKIVAPHEGVNRVRLCSTADNFERTVPWQPLREVGWIVFRHGEQPLSQTQGGPVRLWIKGHSSCGVTELDSCANIKFLDKLEFLPRAL